MAKKDAAAIRAKFTPQIFPLSDKIALKTFWIYF